jgi:hypothetical protein
MAKPSRRAQRRRRESPPKQREETADAGRPVHQRPDRRHGIHSRDGPSTFALARFVPSQSGVRCDCPLVHAKALRREASTMPGSSSMLIS